MQCANHKYIKLLNDFAVLPINSQSVSIFDIAGYPHYENVNSNILSFYLNPNNEHGLGDLFFISLLNLMEADKVNLNNFQINREVSTNNNGRIDIVIETESHIIAIENKIFHYLNNNLNDYSTCIDNRASVNGQDTLKLVLSIRRELCSDGFVNITYDSYFKEIRKNIGKYIGSSSRKWLLYLTDFMNSIDKLNGGRMDIDEEDCFFIENQQLIDELINARNKFISKLNSRIKLLHDLIDKPSDCDQQWIYSKSCLVHDFIFFDELIAFDLYISTDGWELSVFGRNVSSREYLEQLFLLDVLSNKEVQLVESRYILSKYELSTELIKIKDDMISWFNLFREAVNYKDTI